MTKRQFRKNIRLQSYDYRTPGYYFITICTSKWNPWLRNERNKEIVASELALIPIRFLGVKIDYSAIMDDHIHLILVLQNSNWSLSQIIQAFKSMTTLKIKKMAKQALPLQNQKRMAIQGLSLKIGERLWQPNYYEHVIRNEEALHKIREYVQNNPLESEINFTRFYLS